MEYKTHHQSKFFYLFYCLWHTSGWNWKMQWNYLQHIILIYVTLMTKIFKASLMIIYVYAFK